MKANGIIYALKTTRMGLSTQMKRMELISENIANVEKMPDDQGNSYQRKVLISETSGARRRRQFGAQLALQLKKSEASHINPSETDRAQRPDSPPFKVLEEEGSRLVYDPEHPQADENGYVHMPNVDLIEEMVDLVAVSRLYEANVTVINAAKQMARRSMEI